ncbi:MAG: hypothetical protein WEB00_11220 [Dehalococcoidia bacterium]
MTGGGLAGDERLEDNLAEGLRAAELLADVEDFDARESARLVVVDRQPVSQVR